MIEEFNVPESIEKTLHNAEQPKSVTVVQEENREENVTQNKDGSCPACISLSLFACLSVCCPCCIPCWTPLCCCL